MIIFLHKCYSIDMPFVVHFLESVFVVSTIMFTKFPEQYVSTFCVSLYGALDNTNNTISEALAFSSKLRLPLE